MTGTVILSHGFESSPEATKTVAMARVAAARGWQVERADYRAHDVAGLEAAVLPRCAQLRALAQAATGPLVLAGSSLGSFVSGWVSREVDCAGLFLLAVPAPAPGRTHRFDLRAGVPTVLVHGWADTRCPVEHTLRFARERELPLLLVPDGHRLAAHVDWIAAQFGLFLDRVAGAP